MDRFIVKEERMLDFLKDEAEAKNLLVKEVFGSWLHGSTSGA